MQPKQCYHFVAVQFAHVHVERLTEVNEVYFGNIFQHSA